MLQGSVIDISTSLPICDVAVSNGRDVAKTDSEGNFSLPSPSKDGGRWIMISTPSGYRPTDGWFRDVTTSPDASLDFHLLPDPLRGGDELICAQVTDTHLGQYPFDWLKEEFGAIASSNDHPQVQCIAATGDVTQSGSRQEIAEYASVCDSGPLPIIHLVGNHDWMDQAGAGWSEIVGPLWFSLNWGPVHIVGFDTTAFRYSHTLPPAQSDWLAADLSTILESTPILFLTHDQLDDSFYSLLTKQNVVASLSGHWHSSRLYHDGNVLHANQPSSTMGGIDYSARGYTVVRIGSRSEVTVSRHLLGTSLRARKTGVGAVIEPPKQGPSATAQPVRIGAQWAQFHGGPLRHGRSTDAPQPPYERVWQKQLPGALLFGSPVIADDSVYIAAMNEEHPTRGSLVCLSADDGRVRWTTPTQASVKHNPAVCGDLVFSVTVTGQVAAMNRATGDLAWTYQLGDPSQRWVFSSPLVVDDLVIAGAAPHFVALEATSGRVRWLREDLGARDWISSYVSPSADNENVYVGFFWHYHVAYALDIATGVTRWMIDEPNRACSVGSLVLDGDGGLFATCHDATVRAYSTGDGSERWRHELGQDPNTRGGARWSAGTLAVANDVCYVPVGDGSIRAISAQTGQPLWRWDSRDALAGIQAYTRDGRSVLSSPAIVGQTIVCGASDGRLVALDRQTGELNWSDDLEAPVVSSVAVSGNLIVCGASDGWLYAWIAACQSTSG